MVPVVILNPSSKAHMHKKKHRKHRRTTSHHKRRSYRRHRRNPAIPWMGLALAGLGGAAVGGLSYALGMTTLTAGPIAGITAAGGAVIGGLVSMASPMAGAGVAGAGLGIGAKQGIDALMAAPATETKTKAMGRVMDAQQLEAVIDNRVRQLMEGRRDYSPRGYGANPAGTSMPSRRAA